MVMNYNLKENLNDSALIEWLVKDNFKELTNLIKVKGVRGSAVERKIAQDLNIIDKDQFIFCWIIDYPMYELDENSKKIILISHALKNIINDLKIFNDNILVCHDGADLLNNKRSFSEEP